MLDDKGIVVVIVGIVLCVLFPPLGAIVVAFAIYLLISSMFTKL